MQQLYTKSISSIVGPSGSGKSWLFSILLQIANKHVPVDEGKILGVTEVNAERCRFDGEESDIILVDTPFLWTSGGISQQASLKEWLDSKKPCRAAGILYLHNVGSNPYDPYLKVSRHLGLLMPMYYQRLAPSSVHVVPTLTPGAKLSTGRIGDVGASMLKAPFDGRPETAWDVVQELLNNMKLRSSFVGGYSYEETPMPIRWRGSPNWVLEENIALSRALLENAPSGHPDHSLALDEIITLRRSALELTPPGRQERLVSLASLADCLDRRFWEKVNMEDLMEAIPLRRTALEIALPGHQEHRASLVHLATCLEQRFSNEGAMEDLTEVIALRRAILKLTPAAHKEHCLSLRRLADCLDVQYFKSGGTLSVLEEIISLQRAALACNPSSPLSQAMIEASISRCLGEKHHRQRAKPPVIDFAPPARKRSICDPIFPHPTSLLLNPPNHSGVRSCKPIGPTCGLNNNR
ncbi:hypothetical protein EDD16DRAFT_1707614 [Pisolithus croceorrhizus]|nr:hypothetical protein EDD16DRAFT_1707614 [Pisolithus croceorrhizus]KAI6164206.1 hypothetical protein EDD17DRAFT_1872444 [Pisolithus thermaeus]